MNFEDKVYRCTMCSEPTEFRVDSIHPRWVLCNKCETEYGPRMEELIENIPAGRRPAFNQTAKGSA